MEIGTKEALRQGIVTLMWHKVGHLEEVPEGGAAFIYDAHTPEICCSLPRKVDRHAYRASVHPILSNLAHEYTQV